MNPSTASPPPADIDRLAGEIIDSTQSALLGRGRYLKALIATTQAELGASPRQRNVKAARLTAAEVAEHLTAFQRVYERFHEVVVRVAAATVPAPDAEMICQRTGFSRSAGSTVRGYIRAGNDIRALAAHKATKAALATPVRKRKANADVLRRRAERTAAELERIAKGLVSADREGAAETLRPILARIANAIGATSHPARTIEKAAEDGAPFATKDAIFVPLPLPAGRERRLNA